MSLKSPINLFYISVAIFLLINTLLLIIEKYQYHTSTDNTTEEEKPPKEPKLISHKEKIFNQLKIGDCFINYEINKAKYSFDVESKKIKTINIVLDEDKEKNAFLIAYQNNWCLFRDEFDFDQCVYYFTPVDLTYLSYFKHSKIIDCPEGFTLDLARKNRKEEIDKKTPPGFL